MIPSIASAAPDARPILLVPRAAISGRIALWSILLGVGLVCPLVLLIASLHLPQSGASVAEAQARFHHYLREPGSLFLKAVLLMPILEEVFYRGLIFTLFRRYASMGVAVAVSTNFFAVTHLGQGYGTAANALMLGAFFAWLTVRSRSLYPAILCHAAFNFAWLFLIGPAFGLTERMIQPVGSGAVQAVEALFPLWWIGASAGLVIAGLVMFTKVEIRNDATA